MTRRWPKRKLNFIDGERILWHAIDYLEYWKPDPQIIAAIATLRFAIQRVQDAQEVW